MKLKKVPSPVVIVVVGVLVLFSYLLGKSTNLVGVFNQIIVDKETERQEKLAELEFENAVKKVNTDMSKLFKLVDVEKSKNKYVFEVKKEGLVKQDLVNLEKTLGNTVITDFARDFKSDIERPDGFTVAYKSMRQKFKLIVTDTGVQRFGPEPSYSCPCTLRVVGELVATSQ